ncbi:MAG: hydroxyproline-2-epimerase [Phycisphaera sp.]|nr:hydroxyproline-2-epimerase [Phycisphaera sp.]
MQQVKVIDTHTGGEPTRVVVSGGPDLGGGSVAERRARFRDQHDGFRAAVVNEPRGSDVMVGALLVEPVDKACATGVIFFNNVGPLHMCGHGTIGVAVALAHLGRIGIGTHRFETSVGVVTVELHNANEATIENVTSHRHATGVTVDVEGLGPVTGDVAWGGNWFFLVSDAAHAAGGHSERLTVDNVERLTDVTWRIRRALERDGITGDPALEGGHIDHIELFGPPGDPSNDSRNFVLCPGKAYDRSPCGTGTSAKVACLVADGKLEPGAVWRQESIVGSVFEATAKPARGVTKGDDAIIRVTPRIRGAAYVNAESTLILDPIDPFCLGIRG